MQVFMLHILYYPTFFCYGSMIVVLFICLVKLLINGCVITCDCSLCVPRVSHSNDIPTGDTHLVALNTVANQETETSSAITTE